MSNVYAVFRSLSAELVLPEESYTIPIDSSIQDLNEIIAAITGAQMQYDFFINDMLVTLNLGQFIYKHSVSTEEAVVIFCYPSPKVPAFVTSANTPDWVSAIYVFGERLLATNYDGSLHVLDRKEKELELTDSFLLSTHALKHLYLFNSHVAVSGDSGDVKVLKDVAATEIAEFKLGQVPVISMAEFMGGVYAFDESFKLHLIQEKNLQFYEKSTKKGVLRGMQCEAEAVVDLAEFYPNKVFPGEENVFLSLENNVLDYYNIFEEKHLAKIPGPSLIGDMFYDGDQLLVGYMDRGVRLFDLRAGNRVQRAYLGHKSHIYRLCQKNDYYFFSADVSGIIYLWDLRASRPYHKIECYDFSMDKRNDQGRILSCACSGADLFAGGSARKVFWYEV